MKSFFAIVFIGVLVCISSISSSAQQLELYRKDKVKKFDLNSKLHLVQKLGNEDECCNSRRLLGEILESSEDSLKMRVMQLETLRTDEEKSYSSIVKFNTKKKFPSYVIAKSDIKNFEEKGGRLKEVLAVSGGILVFTSIVTAIHALIVDGKDRKALFLSAGIQFGTSIVLIGLGNSKNEKYLIGEDAWQF